VTPIGSLPVSVPGIGYDLLSATAPDPNQVIGLFLEPQAVATPSPGGTPDAIQPPVLNVGDTLNIYTGAIVDHNQNLVPDGTTVRFRVSLSGEGGIIQQYDAETHDGIARISFGLERPGLIEIRAISEPAITSVVLQLDVTTEGVSVTVIPPTASPVVQTPTVISPTPDGSATVTDRNSPGFGHWLMAVVLLSGVVVLLYWVVVRLVSHQWGLRWALASFIGGLSTYNYMFLGLPGGEKLIQLYGLLGILALVLCGAGLGFLAGWLWYALSAKKRKDQADQ
jgi:beta-N-acetylhexosaminidase